MRVNTKKTVHFDMKEQKKGRPSVWLSLCGTTWGFNVSKLDVNTSVTCAPSDVVFQLKYTSDSFGPERVKKGGLLFSLNDWRSLLQSKQLKTIVSKVFPPDMGEYISEMVTRSIYQIPDGDCLACNKQVKQPEETGSEHKEDPYNDYNDYYDYYSV
jgi:hypothetical protein